VLLSLPRKVAVRVFADAIALDPLAERSQRFDAGAIPAGDVPPYNAWTASGKLRAKVVDAGFGLRADFERLEAAGVELAGTFALAKYGRGYRGIKAQLAQEFGCAGVLLYNDPASDGGEKGPVWPDGPWKPDWDAQRGSILPIANAPGDPTTPGRGSPRAGEPGERLDPEQLDKALPRVLCTPLPAREVRRIRERLAKVGGEPLGPGPVEVELELDVPRELRTIRNVVATLPGSGGEVVIAGSHRDAWVRGAHDSASGCVALLRAARHLSERAKGGWTPRASIRLAFWDAEEHGLIGSTEYGEAHASELRERCLAYVNADAAVSGTEFSAGGSPGMLAVLREVAERHRTADGARSLWEDWCARAKDGQPSLGLPGGGSDHAVFVHHLGIPMLEAGFGGNDGGQYHTSFDDFSFVERYLDPGFVGHEMLGRFLADLLGELADRPGAGFDVAEAARAFVGHAKAAGEAGEIAPEHAALLAAAFERCAGQAEKHSWTTADRPHRFYAELAPIFPMQRREWFRNALWAPALENGYGSERFPVLSYTARHLGTADQHEYLTGDLIARIDELVATLTSAKSDR
jgi:N-acetylated-alpha-linked acidic dipeptidase